MKLTEVMFVRIMGLPSVSKVREIKMQQETVLKIYISHSVLLEDPPGC